MDNYSATPNTQPESSELSNQLFELDQYTDATTGQRFLNFLIDNLFMRFVVTYASGYLLGYLLAYTAPDFMQSLIDEGESGARFWILSFTIAYFNYLVYYTFCEKVFKGYTLGKLITGTKAIRNDGSELTFKDAILRSLSRIVPFEAFSALGGRPWHDTWTKTRVVKSR
jgi:uncharacterized RDD family membrane protein YckC